MCLTLQTTNFLYQTLATMNTDDGLVHDEVEIEDFEYDPNADTFTYPCPCGDEFVVSRVSDCLQYSR